MVYPQEHILLRFNGHFGAVSSFLDRWSCGLRFGLATAAPVYDAAKLQTFVNSAQTAANTLMTATNVNAGTATFHDYVSGAQIGVLGNYSPTTQVTVISPTTQTAGIGAPINPWNTAHVISLRTNFPRGRGSNGRVYWPCQSLGVAAGTGRLTPTQVNNRLIAFKAFLDALNVAANTYSAGCRLIVASKVGGGVHATVVSIRADDRLDSIERRENDQPSAWSTQALA
jgi:hypothetical protein